MTYTQILQWLKTNIAIYIRNAIAANPGCIYTEDWLAGIACRETGKLIAKLCISPAGNPVDPLMVCSLLRGDYSQRPGETEKQYHGFGITQIDIVSFPDFVHSGNWKNPNSCFLKTISIMDSAKAYLLGKVPSLAADSLNHYITASYNCGVGNEHKIIENNLDPDAYTTGHNYSQAVFEFAAIYKELV